MDVHAKIANESAKAYVALGNRIVFLLFVIAVAALVIAYKV